jgi:hypothetical protein
MSARKRSGSKKVSKARPTAGNGSKRFRRTALALTFILLVGFAGYWAFREAGDPRFALSRVVVLGATHTPESDVLAAAAFPVGANVWLLDTRAAQRRVEDLPWVASANVERRWPNRVSVRVDERVPAASVLMPSGGTAEEPVAQVALIDSAMHVLAIGPPEGPAAGLPTLRITPAPSDLQPGADISGTDVERAYDALVQLRALGLRATEVDFTSSSARSTTSPRR